MAEAIKNLAFWLRVARAPFFSASVAPILVGTALAFQHGYFSWSRFLLTLLSGLLLHAGTNINNDYFDYSNGLDTSTSLGSSGVLPQKLLPPSTLRLASLLLLGGGLLLGLILAWVIQSWILAGIALLGTLAGYYYTAPPLHLKYRALGVPLVFVMMGNLLVMSAYLVQTHSLQQSFLPSLPVAFLVAAILHANEMRDREDDRLAGIKTLSLLLGAEGARLLYLLLLAGPYVTIALAVPTGQFPPWSLLIFLSLPSALGLFRLALRYPFLQERPEDRIRQSQRLVMQTVLLHLQGSFLLALGFFFAHYF